ELWPKRSTARLFRLIHSSLSALVPGSAQWNNCWPCLQISIVTPFCPRRAPSTRCTPSSKAVSFVNSLNTSTSSCLSNLRNNCSASSTLYLQLSTEPHAAHACRVPAVARCLAVSSGSSCCAAPPGRRDVRLPAPAWPWPPLARRRTPGTTPHPRHDAHASCQ